MHNAFHFFLAFILLGLSSAASAENDIAVGGGWFNFDRERQNSANFLGEWRGNYLLHGLRPVAGASVNTQRGVYGYAGFDYDWEMVPHWIITPGLDIGAWGKGGSIDLGGVFEFHESIELDYKFDNGYRVGTQLAHTSNANIYSSNPGVNTVMATFSFPIR